MVLVRRAFRSELVKLTRWSVLVGALAMAIVTVSLSYFALTSVGAPGAAGDERFASLVEALPTSQGLVAVLSFAQKFINVIAIAMVGANVAAEWSQGTMRNLLVREPGRLRMLAGKMLALLLFVAVSATLALLLDIGVSLYYSNSHAMPVAPWLSSTGLTSLAGFWGGELLGLFGVSLLGMIIAVLTRSLGTAIGVSVAYALIGEDLLEAVWPNVGTWAPVHMFSYLWGTPAHFTVGPPPMGYTADVIFALAYMVIFVLVTAIAFRRMDITA
jgi:ABC-type transport system involved in multi-copper enzyme maturation permease subunit